MESAPLSQLQKELALLPPKKLLEICVRIVKHKKENKELLSYLLFEEQDEKNYIKNVKEQMDNGFSSMNRNTIYLTKKSLRKILRDMNKHIKYSGLKETELELRIYFCSEVKSKHIPIDRSTVLSNLYKREIEKIKSILSKLHEDLQYDYKLEVDKLIS